MARIGLPIQNFIPLVYRKVDKMQELFRSRDGHRNALVEYISALMVKWADLHVQDNKANNVLDYQIITSGAYEPTVVGKQLYDRAEARKAIHLLERGGGCYPPYQQKRFKNYIRAQKYLSHARTFWDGTDIFQTIFQEFIDDYAKKTLSNYDVAQSDPEKIIGDKDPNVSTGWVGRIGNRGSMAQFLPEYDLAGDIMQYFNDYKQATFKFPEEGSIITLPSQFKGIDAGVRSDVAEADIQRRRYMVICEAREVNVSVPSAFFNDALAGKEWTQYVWGKYASRHHLLPFDTRSYLKVMTTPPVTADFSTDVDGPLLLSVDFGWQDKTGTLTQQGSSFGEPIVKLGADQVVMQGIVERNMRGDDFFHLISGAPWTMTQYLLTVGQVISDFAFRNQLHIEIFQVGDDLHIMGTLDDLIVLYNKFGPWFRTKGMQGNSVFILGLQIWHDSPDEIETMLLPRVLKSSTGPTAAAKLGGMQEVPIGTTLHMEANKVLQEQAQEAWRLYPEIINFRGHPDDYITTMGSIYKEARARLAELGHSEWIQYFMQYEDIDE